MMNLQQAQSTERLNPDTGIMQNEYGGSLGRLEVLLVDARNLASMDYTGTSDPFVKMSIEAPDGSVEELGSEGVVCGEPSEQKSSIMWKDLNPRWDEAFFFKPIYRKDGILKIMVFDKDPVLSDELMGVAELPFSDLHDQLKHDVWKQLHSDPNHRASAREDRLPVTKAKGSIHIKAQFLYSQVEYFLGCVKRETFLKDKLESEKKDIAKVLFELRSPFGAKRNVVLSGKDGKKKGLNGKDGGSGMFSNGSNGSWLGQNGSR